MLKNIASIFSRKRKVIEDEIVVKAKIDELISKFVKEEILKNKDVKFKLTYTLNKDVVKIETDNKIIAQEIALRIRSLETKLRNDGISIKKLLI